MPDPGDIEATAGAAPSPTLRRKPPREDKVSRARRAAFAFTTVGFSLLMMSLFALKAITNPAAMSAMEGFKDVVVWIGASYIGGSAVDYSSSHLMDRFRHKNDGDDQGDGKVSD